MGKYLIMMEAFYEDPLDGKRSISLSCLVDLLDCYAQRATARWGRIDITHVEITHVELTQYEVPYSG